MPDITLGVCPLWQLFDNFFAWRIPKPKINPVPGSIVTEFLKECSHELRKPPSRIAEMKMKWKDKLKLLALLIITASVLSFTAAFLQTNALRPSDRAKGPRDRLYVQSFAEPRSSVRTGWSYTRLTSYSYAALSMSPSRNIRFIAAPLLSVHIYLNTLAQNAYFR